MASIVYIKLKKKIKAQMEQRILLQDIAEVVADQNQMELQQMPIIQLTSKYGTYAVIEAIHVLRVVKHAFPHLQIQMLGPVHSIIERSPETRLRKKLFVFLTWIFLFTGSGLAIMNFHTDVSMKKVHDRIYFLVTGDQVDGSLWLQIPYSIGIGVGMILFFNHVFKRRFNEEPSPMELEMYLYQETIDQYVIEHEKVRAEGDSNDSTSPR
ncbi:stage V sporulation protein AA [Baia soyae]|uniref:Stage V sporulation protein AA n=1 Tax=Baia soyae TaxID=1544746 RepID=A0A4V2SYF1_9BACL|nr:stage V sporulation protein AA [Baia soyae]TCP69902.1 stage V sporulation protein AA [Baia soyae]